MTTDPRWREIDALLREALDLPERERPDFVLRRTDSDLQLRNAVQALLDVEGTAEIFLKEPFRIDPETTREMFLLIALRALQSSSHDDANQP